MAKVNATGLTGMGMLIGAKIQIMVLMRAIFVRDCTFINILLSFCMLLEEIVNGKKQIVNHKR